MRAMTLALVLAAVPVLASAEDLGPPLTAEEFDALTLGKTITYTAEGEVYGIEEYRPGHKVVWAFAEGDCQEGDWFAQGEQICFDYHHAEVGLQCWTFHHGPEGLVAWFEGRQDGEPLVSLRESTVPLNCPGPEIGV
ncbi:hypothetical protein [Rhodobacter maris]|uniref:Uncharacterized protein n=1 Tax=Rhodobacter maris TaxID=446682 RepID=A0A285SLD6_9RHOB|nr:hypothetical protein [Rhodobacter maris]SOC08820.1 hypothetical protein SAMN05877831_10725 [Rhodobacter maris]